ncbi:MAG: substrate-binding domain-containing protein [Chitinivibrionales bacterium]|nr:substrate-binding domain-containing protein [Chitinivibrionales bacterium]
MRDTLIQSWISKVIAIAIITFTCTLVADQPAKSVMRLATTTSTENSGLLNVLLPEFTKKSGVTVQVIAVGSGKAMKLGENGDVDAVLVHSRAAEDAFVANGFGLNRRDVMYNDFVIVGSPADPAGIKQSRNALEALQKIATRQAPFVSRGDESGTHIKEKELWAGCAITPAGGWYLQAGQGMEAVILMADEKQGYTLTDRGTFISVEDKVSLLILCEGDSTLFNPYGVIAVNWQKHPHVKKIEALRFIEWITSNQGQQLIAEFKIRGKQLFFPNANASIEKKGINE